MALVPTTPDTQRADDEIRLAVERLAAHERDVAAMARAAQRMDESGAEVYRRHGALDIGVPAIRELRG
jgi:hypothetical protein